MNENETQVVPKYKAMDVTQRILKISLTIIQIGIALATAKQSGLFDIGLFF